MFQNFHLTRSINKKNFKTLNEKPCTIYKTIGILTRTLKLLMVIFNLSIFKENIEYVKIRRG